MSDSINAKDVASSLRMMKDGDEIQVDILNDGTARIVLDEISAANHRKADEMLSFFQTLLGGETEIAKRKTGHVHSHAGVKHSH